MPNHYFKEGTKLKIILPPDALSLAGDGNGDLTDLYIESVIYKGEHNEIILESDTRKWLMLSDTDEQVATYVPLSFVLIKRNLKFYPIRRVKDEITQALYSLYNLDGGIYNDHR